MAFPFNKTIGRPVSWMCFSDGNHLGLVVCLFEADDLWSCWLICLIARGKEKWATPSLAACLGFVGFVLSNAHNSTSVDLRGFIFPPESGLMATPQQFLHLEASAPAWCGVDRCDVSSECLPFPDSFVFTMLTAGSGLPLTAPSLAMGNNWTKNPLCSKQTAWDVKHSR